MTYYDKLNKILASTLEDKNRNLELAYLKETVKLAQIIIDNTPDIAKESFEEYVSLNDSINIVGDFLYNLKDNYSSIYFNILQEENDYNGKEEPSVEFVPFEGNDLSEVRSDGKVIISYQNNINDIYTIIHEITHKFSQQKYQNSTIKSFLGETSTIAMEFLMEDYLLNNTSYSKEEIKARKQNRFANTYSDASAVLFEYTLLELYKKNGNITKDSLLAYLNSLDKNSKEYEIFSVKGENYLNDIVNKGDLQFPIRQRYVIGTVLACDFNQKQEASTIKNQQLSYLIDILGHTDLNFEDDIRIIKGLDIPIFKNNNFEITDESMQRITNNYKSETNDLLQKNNDKNKSYQ